MARGPAACYAPQTMTAPARPLPFAEFVALMAMLFALTALSIDAMLPALPQIARDLSPGAPNAAQLVVTSFVLGLGLGTLLMGPLSDALGRRRVIAFGIGLYLIGCGLAVIADSMALLLAARVLQGLGIAAPRTAGIALVRDLYEGRRMARVMSIVMTIFILVPAAAPWLGQFVIAIAGWRAVFLAFILCGTAALAWFLTRQPETLLVDRRRPFRIGTILAAAREVTSHHRVMLHTAALTLGLGQMFALLSASQPIYDQYFERGDSFAAWFAVMALLAGTAGLLNASLVMRLGMRRLATMAFTAQTGIAGTMVAATLLGVIPPGADFATFFGWSVSVFFMAGLVFGNLNALTLEPLGHIAGLAAAVVGALATVGAVIVALPVVLAFDGTPLPVMAGVFTASALAATLMRIEARTAPQAL
jgi:MFS transporter, DHA1 family, multidrug resistance protein